MVNERGNRTEGRCLLPGPGNCSSAMSVIQLPATLFKSSLGSGSAIVNFPLIKRHALCGKTPGKQRKVGSADRCQLADEHGLLDQVADFFRHVVSASAHGRNPAQRRSFESQSGSSRKTRHVVGSCQSVLKSEPNSLAEDEPVIKNSTCVVEPELQDVAEECSCCVSSLRSRTMIEEDVHRDGDRGGARMSLCTIMSKSVSLVPRETSGRCAVDRA